MILALMEQEPDRVEAFGAYHLDPAIADMVNVHLSFANGTRAEISASWLHPAKEHRLVVVGTEGMAVFDDSEPWERKLLHYPHRIEWRRDLPVAVAADPIPIGVAPGEPLKAEIRHFLDSIRSKGRPVTDADEGIRVLKVLRRASDALLARRAA
jgi:UDP-2-acetamido-3-amino-2,3-dideoxy-glucuronate N-acetyltransferase